MGNFPVQSRVFMRWGQQFCRLVNLQKYADIISIDAFLKPRKSIGIEPNCWVSYLNPTCESFYRNTVFVNV